MDHIYHCIRLLSILNIMHDNLEHSHSTEVRYLHQSSVWVHITDKSLQRFVAWYVLGAAGCLSPILYSTINVIVRDDAEERALIMVCPFPSSCDNNNTDRISSSTEGLYDDIRIFVQHLGSFAGVSNRRPRWCTEMAKGMANIIRVFLPSMGWLHGLCVYMAKVNSRRCILVDIQLTSRPREQKKEALVSPQGSSDEETGNVVVDGTQALKSWIEFGEWLGIDINP